MRLFRSGCFLVLLAAAATCFAQRKEDWLPITQADLQYKDVPGHPGAPAVRLYYANYLDDNASSEFVYERIKILNDKALQPKGAGGLGLADVEVPVLTVSGIRESMTELRARTIRPDGSIVEYTGKPFEKTLYKGRGNKIAVMAFTMPEVKVGSIIEYKFHYALAGLYGFQRCVFGTSDRWILQSNLYTMHESFYFRPYEGGVYDSHTQVTCGMFWEGAKVASVFLNMDKWKSKIKKSGNEMELELDNVPGVEEEGFMPPAENYEATAIFFYAPKGGGTLDEEWQEVARLRFHEPSRSGNNPSVDEFLGRERGIKDVVAQLIAGENDPEKKLRKIYDRAQQVRNLSYERQRTEEERKKENLQKNTGVAEVLAHGYGTDDDITQLFIAMARAAGFDAEPVLMSDRSRRFFVKDWTAIEQLRKMVAVVKVGNGDVFLDPGTRFCPYGILPWKYTVTDGLKMEKKGGTFVKAPPVAYDKSVTSRTAVLRLAADGTATGDVTVEFKGEDALERRLDAIDRDDAGRKKALEDELREWMPSGAMVKMVSATGWEASNTPLVATFSVEVPNYTSVAGKLSLVPAFLFQTKQNRAFSHGDRKYPIYFPYPFTESDVAQVVVPPGANVESLPDPQKAPLKLPQMGTVGLYQMVSNFDGSQLVSQRRLDFNGVYFNVEQYSEIKGFFGKVQTSDEQQIALRGVNVRAEK
jgi:hypothetical protein